MADVSDRGSFWASGAFAFLMLVVGLAAFGWAEDFSASYSDCRIECAEQGLDGAVHSERGCVCTEWEPGQ